MTKAFRGFPQSLQESADVCEIKPRPILPNPLQFIILIKLSFNGKCYEILTQLYSEHSLVLPAVLYGCETWSPTLREKHKLTVFDAVLLSKIFGPKRDEVRGDCRRPRNKELHDLYCLTIIIG
jgi:hypothetical protein